MELIEASEMLDFLATLQRKHLTAADFELREIDTTDPKTDEIYALCGSLTVIRKSNRRERQYPIGDGTAWVPEFQKDLERGRFG